MKTIRKCSRCGQPGHRAPGCPLHGQEAPGEKLTGGAPPKTARELVAVLVAAAQGLGQDKALAAVEEATGEVLRQSMAMRLDLIKSRGANAKLRARLADRAEARNLAKLDKEEGSRIAQDG